MDQAKFETAVDALTTAVSQNRLAADALQFLLADYMATKSAVEELDRKLTSVTDAPSIVGQVLSSTRSARSQAINALEGLAAEQEQVLQLLAEAQVSINVSSQKSEEYLRDYAELDTQSEAFVSNIKGLAGGIMKSFLGPAAEFGPLKSIADELFA